MARRRIGQGYYKGFCPVNVWDIKTFEDVVKSCLDMNGRSLVPQKCRAVWFESQIRKPQYTGYQIVDCLSNKYILIVRSRLEYVPMTGWEREREKG